MSKSHNPDADNLQPTLHLHGSTGRPYGNPPFDMGPLTTKDNAIYQDMHFIQFENAADSDAGYDPLASLHPDNQPALEPKITQIRHIPMTAITMEEIRRRRQGVNKLMTPRQFKLEYNQMALDVATKLQLTQRSVYHLANITQQQDSIQKSIDGNNNTNNNNNNNNNTLAYQDKQQQPEPSRHIIYNPPPPLPIDDVLVASPFHVIEHAINKEVAQYSILLQPQNTSTMPTNNNNIANTNIDTKLPDLSNFPRFGATIPNIQDLEAPLEHAKRHRFMQLLDQPLPASGHNTITTHDMYTLEKSLLSSNNLGHHHHNDIGTVISNPITTPIPLPLDDDQVLIKICVFDPFTQLLQLECILTDDMPLTALRDAMGTSMCPLDQADMFDMQTQLPSHVEFERPQDVFVENIMAENALHEDIAVAIEGGYEYEIWLRDNEMPTKMNRNNNNNNSKRNNSNNSNNNNNNFDNSIDTTLSGGITKIITADDFECLHDPLNAQGDGSHRFDRDITKQLHNGGVLDKTGKPVLDVLFSKADAVLSDGTATSVNTDLIYLEKPTPKPEKKPIQPKSGKPTQTRRGKKVKQELAADGDIVGEGLDGDNTVNIKVDPETDLNMGDGDNNDSGSDNDGDGDGDDDEINTNTKKTKDKKSTRRTTTTTTLVTTTTTTTTIEEHSNNNHNINTDLDDIQLEDVVNTVNATTTNSNVLEQVYIRYELQMTTIQTQKNQHLNPQQQNNNTNNNNNPEDLIETTIQPPLDYADYLLAQQKERLGRADVAPSNTGGYHAIRQYYQAYQDWYARVNTFEDDFFLDQLTQQQEQQEQGQKDSTEKPKKCRGKKDLLTIQNNNIITPTISNTTSIILPTIKDLLYKYKQQSVGWIPKTLHLLHPSAFFLIGNTFYDDRRSPLSHSLSDNIIQYTLQQHPVYDIYAIPNNQFYNPEVLKYIEQQKNNNNSNTNNNNNIPTPLTQTPINMYAPNNPNSVQQQRHVHSGLGLFKQFHAEAVKLSDIPFRIGEQYLYQHQGNCQHVIMFTEMRIKNTQDYNDKRMYPIITYRSIHNHHSLQQTHRQIVPTHVLTTTTVNSALITNSTAILDKHIGLTTQKDKTNKEEKQQQQEQEQEASIKSSNNNTLLNNGIMKPKLLQLFERNVMNYLDKYKKKIAQSSEKRARKSPKQPDSKMDDGDDADNDEDDNAVVTTTTPTTTTTAEKKQKRRSTKKTKEQLEQEEKEKERQRLLEERFLPRRLRTQTQEETQEEKLKRRRKAKKSKQIKTKFSLFESGSSSNSHDDDDDTSDEDYVPTDEENNRARKSSKTDKQPRTSNRLKRQSKPDNDDVTVTTTTTTTTTTAATPVNDKSTGINIDNNDNIDNNADNANTDNNNNNNNINTKNKKNNDNYKTRSIQPYWWRGFFLRLPHLGNSKSYTGTLLYHDVINAWLLAHKTNKNKNKTNTNNNNTNSTYDTYKKQRILSDLVNVPLSSQEMYNAELRDRTIMPQSNVVGDDVLGLPKHNFGGQNDKSSKLTSNGGILTSLHERLDQCITCDRGAMYLVYGDRLLPYHPSPICEYCYNMLHYTDKHDDTTLVAEEGNQEQHHVDLHMVDIEMDENNNNVNNNNSQQDQDVTQLDLFLNPQTLLTQYKQEQYELEQQTSNIINKNHHQYQKLLAIYANKAINRNNTNTANNNNMIIKQQNNQNNALINRLLQSSSTTFTTKQRLYDDYDTYRIFPLQHAFKLPQYITKIKLPKQIRRRDILRFRITNNNNNQNNTNSPSQSIQQPDNNNNTILNKSQLLRLRQIRRFISMRKKIAQLLIKSSTPQQIQDNDPEGSESYFGAKPPTYKYLTHEVENVVMNTVTNVGVDTTVELENVLEQYAQRDSDVIADFFDF